nr:MAG TPA: hypothetical protein [Caudoviricetes sp.]
MLLFYMAFLAVRVRIIPRFFYSIFNFIYFKFFNSLPLACII